MARYADKHLWDIQLNVGNLVYVSTEHLPLACKLFYKLAPYWVGFFPISGILSWVTYHINFPEEYRCIHPIFYISYFHPHVGPVPTHPPPPLLLNNDAAGKFEVKDILNSYLDCYGN